MAAPGTTIKGRIINRPQSINRDREGRHPICRKYLLLYAQDCICMFYCSEMILPKLLTYAEGCDEVKDEGKETKRKTKSKVAR